MSTAKIKLNNSARATICYAISKAGARVIGGSAAPWVERDQLSHNQLQAVVRNATQKFMVSIDLNDRVKRSVGHTSISFPPGEDLDDQQFAEYCEKYLAAMILTSERPELLKEFNEPEFRKAVEDFRETELHKYTYSIVRHTDEPHPHAHIVYSRINLETERSISTSFERYRSQQILRDLERQYELTAVPNSWEVGRRSQTISQLQKEAATGEVSVQKRLQDLLENVGQRSASVTEFIENAQAEGIEVRMGFTRTGKSKGISYSLDGVALSGNSLGTRYSFKHSDPGLCKTFELAYSERDNPKIQELCQRKPLTYEQRQQNALRNDITSSLGGTAEAVQRLDCSTPALASTPRSTGAPGGSADRINDTTPGGRPGTSAITDRSGGIDRRPVRRIQSPQFASDDEDRRAIEPNRSQTPLGYTAGESNHRRESTLDAINQQLRDFESSSHVELHRINQQLADLNRALEEKRDSRLKRQQQSRYAAQILPLAEAIFEHYATIGATFGKESEASTEYQLQVDFGNKSYLLSRDDRDFRYNVRREATKMDVQAQENITISDVQLWQDLHRWLVVNAQLGTETTSDAQKTEDLPALEPVLPETIELPPDPPPVQEGPAASEPDAQLEAHRQYYRQIYERLSVRLAHLAPLDRDVRVSLLALQEYSTCDDPMQEAMNIIAQGTEAQAIVQRDLDEAKAYIHAVYTQVEAVLARAKSLERER
ncbi:relaxase/mobilization nuclease domain-containing protein [Leptolyngbya sp. NIES-2104]|uniref:relaxase/mobilization nuclease domain-containing protein n=1 Tax=Leptolyngbya sp. NIES-2104 TaxID=1552121 RepID=UPI0006EC70AE|nr:relaxase/mobilization nuclease domain-containing protein [Leptolyngbya sp. NIES-2104]GAQ00198.1 mobilization protein [Leptolyngbya sp. NIES-2104]